MLSGETSSGLKYKFYNDPDIFTFLGVIIDPLGGGNTQEPTAADIAEIVGREFKGYDLDRIRFHISNGQLCLQLA